MAPGSGGENDMIRVLLVDDDEDLLDSLALVLAGDFEIETATDGTAALRLFEQGRRYDVLVVDQLMPHMDGRTLLEELQRRGWLPPTAVISAHLDLLPQEAEPAVGAILVKPFDPGRLAAEIRRLAGQGGGERQRLPRKGGPPGGTSDGPGTPRPGARPAGREDGPSHGRPASGSARRRAPVRPVRPVRTRRATPVGRG